ncbi:SH3 domain-containing protein [Govanella unica]|uniref:SH3 domain-containing protein n=1 Tax=Govanella unica TaxID=2975056 RepID=UPI003D1ADE5F
MWAGPSPDYPRVTRLPAGAAVQVFGCLDDWYWCDVGWRGQRGWVTAANLYGRYGGNSVYVSQYGPRFGLGIVLYNAGSYWDRNYRNRYSWYRDRDRWVNYRPQHRPGINRPSNSHRPEMNRPGYDRPGYDRPDMNRPGSSRPEASRPSSPRPDVSRPEPSRPPQMNRPGSDRPGFDRPGSDRPSGPGGGRPGEQGGQGGGDRRG